MQANIRDHTIPLAKQKIYYAKDPETILRANSPMGYMKVASITDLKPGQMKSVEVEQKEICLANVNGNFYAIGNSCTHAGCMLSDGKLDGPNVKCSCHFSVFNVQTGAVVKGPAAEAEPTYQVKIEGDQVLINI